MSIFNKKKNEPVIEIPVEKIPEPVEEIREPEPVKEPEEPKMPKQITVIGAGTIFEGDITTEDRLEIDGTVKGNIRSTSELNIGGTGLLFGNAQIASLNVDGAVQGEVFCSGNTHITNKGSVRGTLVSAFLDTADGAVIDGTVRLGAAAAKASGEQTPEISLKEGSAEEIVSTEEPAAVSETADTAETTETRTPEETQTPEIDAIAEPAPLDELPQDEPVTVDELFR